MSDNHSHEDLTATALKDLMEQGDIHEDVLFDVDDITLPAAWQDEYFASVAVEKQRELLLLRLTIAANQGAENEAAVAQLRPQLLALRIMLTKIKRDHPEALRIAAIVADQEARKLREARKVGKA